MNLFLISGLAGLVWFGALHQALYDNWAAVIFFISVTFLAAVFLVASILDKRKIRIPLAFPLLLCLGSLLFSLRHSFDYTATLWDCWGWLYVVVSYILFVNITRRDSERRFFIGMSSAVFIFLAYLAIRQFMHLLPEEMANSWGAISATLVNSNVLAGFCLFWIYPLFLDRSPTPMDYLSRAGVLSLLLISGSWAAWVALSLGGLFLIRHHHQFPRFAGAVTLGVVLMIALKLTPWISINTKEANRLRYFNAAIHMVEKEPLSGVGLSGYATAYPYFKEASPMESTRLAHSLPLQIAAETGFVGILAWLILIFLWGFYFKKSAWSLPDELDLEPYKASLIVVLSYSLVSISMDYLLNRYVLFIFLALLAPKKSPFDLTLQQTGTKAMAMAVLLFFTPFWLKLFRAEQFFSAGSYARALELNPRLGDAWAKLADVEPNPEQARRLRMTAWHWKKNRDFLMANAKKPTA